MQDKRPKKIAFVSDAIYPYNKGGKETRLYELSTRLAQKGYDVHIYTMKWWEESSNKLTIDTRQLTTNNSQPTTITLHAICPYIPLYSGERRSIKQAIFFGISCFKLLFENFDVVDVDSMPYFPVYSMRIVTWLKGKKLFATWHEVWKKSYWVEYAGWKGYVGYFLEKFAAHLPNVIHTISESTTKSVRSIYGRKYQVVTSGIGIDIDRINRIKPSKEKYDVIYVGRLLKHKHVDVLLEAIGELKRQKKMVTCCIVGEGPEEENLKNIIKKQGIEKLVEFKGRIENHDDVIALIKSSKVFVLLSTREGFGIVVLEANACGVPVITTDHPDNAAMGLVKSNNSGYIINIDVKNISSMLYTPLKLKVDKVAIENSVRKYDFNKSIYLLLMIYSQKTVEKF